MRYYIYIICTICFCIWFVYSCCFVYIYIYGQHTYIFVVFIVVLVVMVDERPVYMIIGMYVLQIAHRIFCMVSFHIIFNGDSGHLLWAVFPKGYVGRGRRDPNHSSVL